VQESTSFAVGSPAFEMKGLDSLKTSTWIIVSTMVVCVMFSGRLALSGEFAITSFGNSGQLTFNTLNDGTNYNYQVEWAPSPAGPWSPFTGAGGSMGNIVTAPGSIVTSTVPMCYRVVASLGDYMVVDLSGGTNASEYPVSYYRSLADLPGGVGVNSDAYKTTNLVFRRIPAGTFTMGSPVGELGRQRDETQHQVTLTQSFYIGVFEVTQKQWELVMGTWPSYFINAAYRDARPVEQVSYDMIRGSSAGMGWPTNNNVDADSFMGRLRARTGKAFDIPTEAQWEFAGRGGITTALNTGKNLSDEHQCPNMSEAGRYFLNGAPGATRNGDTSVGSAKVGSYLPNAWGLYDIHGNVWEWCLDWFGEYPATVCDPVGAILGWDRVHRGGGWDFSPDDCRVAVRGALSSDFTEAYLGFRVALPLGQ
jgi:formylglycine-generating enzyme required for sulfatase activity